MKNCPDCGGSGKTLPNSPERCCCQDGQGCTVCGGSGYTGKGYFTPEEAKDCEKCGGSGQVPDD